MNNILKKIITYIAFSVLYINLYSQVAPNTYFLEFTDKNHNEYNTSKPEDFLSVKALERRKKQNIPIDYYDLPVSKFYLDSLRSLGLYVMNTSKWFNAATVYTTDSTLIDTICNIGFIKNNLKPSISIIDKVKIKRYPTTGRGYSRVKYKNSEENYYDYGESAPQIYINSGQKLHNEGYRGKEIMIAITDAGYTMVPSLPSFDSLFANNQILATRNFVKGGEHVYDYSTHGMKVLSILAGNYPGKLIGSAPEASYLLLQTEDAESELIIEEINWVSAAEFADSMGADIINVSLGYVDFDDPGFNHAYNELDGKTAIISRAATIAARKGILVISAAANNGDSSTHPWLAAPADADSILSVGAIWESGNYASFSSIGPSADGRVKPEVVAMGGRAFNQSTNGEITNGNGTSFSAPLISGFAACLWQKYPDKTNIEIRNAIIKSSSFYNTPTDTLGYGIPDFELASKILSEQPNSNNNNTIINVFPNPFSHSFEIQLTNNKYDTISFYITDISGKIVFRNEKSIIAHEKNMKLKVNDLKNYTKGVYVLIIKINNSETSLKIIKE